MDQRTGKTHALLGGLVLLGNVLIGVVLAAGGCGRLGAAELSIPLKGSPGPVPKYVTRFSVANLDDHRLALAWVAESEKGNDVLWTCTVTEKQDGTLLLDREPEQVDQQSIGDVTVVASGGLYGVVYVWKKQLAYRWPWNGPLRTLTAPVEQSVMRSAAVADPALGIIAFALLSQLEGGERPTIALVGYVLSPSGTEATRIARIYLAPNRRRQPPPQVSLTANGIDVGMVIAAGTLIDAATPIGELQRLAGSAGEFVTLRLSVTPGQRLHIDRLNRFSLPAEPELERTWNVALPDSFLGAIATAGPIVRLVTFGPSSARIEQVSSRTGCGEMYSSPTVQSLTTSDSEGLVTWIDTEAQLGEMSLSNGGFDPTIYGGEIRARRVTPSGQTLSKRVPGFPIHTQAQCIRMGKLDGQPFIAWIEASRRGSSRGWPRPVALRIRLLGATHKR